jgi:hypothetical protein
MPRIADLYRHYLQEESRCCLLDDKRHISWEALYGLQVGNPSKGQLPLNMALIRSDAQLADEFPITF